MLCSLTHGELRKAEFMETEQSGGGQGLGLGVRDVGQRVKSPSYKIDMTWGSNAQHGDY